MCVVVVCVCTCVRQVQTARIRTLFELVAQLFQLAAEPLANTLNVNAFLFALGSNFAAILVQNTDRLAFSVFPGHGDDRGPVEFVIHANGCLQEEKTAHGEGCENGSYFRYGIRPAPPQERDAHQILHGINANINAQNRSWYSADESSSARRLPLRSFNPTDCDQYHAQNHALTVSATP